MSVTTMNPITRKAEQSKTISLSEIRANIDLYADGKAKRIKVAVDYNSPVHLINPIRTEDVQRLCQVSMTDKETTQFRGNPNAGSLEDATGSKSKSGFDMYKDTTHFNVRDVNDPECSFGSMGVVVVRFLVGEKTFENSRSLREGKYADEIVLNAIIQKPLRLEGASKTAALLRPTTLLIVDEGSEIRGIEINVDHRQKMQREEIMDEVKAQEKRKIGRIARK